MALGDVFGYSEWMTPEEKERLKNSQILAMGANLLKSSAPSTDPRAGSMAYGLGSSLEAMLGARQKGVGDIMQQRQFGQQQDLTQALQNVPRYESIPAAGPMTPQGQMPMAQGPERPLGDYMGDIGKELLSRGQVGPGVQAMAASQPREPEVKTKALLYQDKKGDYRQGLFDSKGNLIKDLRAATEKELKSGGVTVNVGDLKGLPAESAGKLAMLNQAYRDVEQAEKFLFPEGKLDLFTQAGGYLNIPAGKGRELSSRIENAVAAKLRLETGAAANESEVKNISKRFKPVPGLDDEAATRDKLNRLKRFMDEAAFFIDPSGKYAKGYSKKKEKEDYDYEYIPGKGLQ